MKRLYKILKISAKESFLKLRKESPYFCTALGKNISIGREFWNHINFSKYRTIKEIIYRLSIISLVEKSLKEGILVETRNMQDSEKISYRIDLRIKNETFCMVCLENIKRDEISLLSCFVED